jgi:iron-sulfur cluster assembly protein
MLVQLTENAVKEIKHIMEQQEMAPDVTYVRVGISGGGCSGFQYTFNLDEKYNEEKDVLLEQGDLKIVVDKRSGLYLEGTTVDWVEDLNRRGFAFNNPNAVRTCGCAKSFSV